jgi:hypothetical protein
MATMTSEAAVTMAKSFRIFDLRLEIFNLSVDPPID